MRPAQLQLCVPIETLSTPKRLQQSPLQLKPIAIDIMHQDIMIQSAGRTLEAQPRCELDGCRKACVRLATLAQRPSRPLALRKVAL